VKIFEGLFKRIAEYLSRRSSLQLANQYSRAVNSANSSAFITDVGFEKRLDYFDNWANDGNVVARPVRVIMLGLRGFPDVQGGIETHAENLAPILVKLGCDLEVIVRSSYQQQAVGKTWCGVKFTKLWAPKSRGFEAVVHTFLGVMYAAIKRPDVLHIHAVGPALMTPLARLFGLCVVVTHHGQDYNRQKWGFVARHVLLLGEWLGMRFSNSRIVISDVIKDIVVRKHAVHAELIYNGVVLPNLDSSTSHLEQFNLTKNKYIILVSRLVPEKRHLDLIAAFNKANLPGIKLAIVGSSDHPDNYVQSIINAASENPNIVLTGFQKGDALRSLYTYAALFVLPSSHEGLSISLLEALSYGLPVVASDIPANLELGLGSESYFALGDVDKLASLLSKHTEQMITAEKRIYLRAWVNTRYNWTTIAEKTFKEYRSAIQ
jgi:glycosyltransferase involved in cell wall biosynthesis